MKKNILTVCLVALLAATAVTGATLAYFTDTEEAVNEFTIGSLDITLNEVFAEDEANLVPGVNINKDVTITLEEGSEDAYVWYTYAIPAVLDNRDDASRNIVHINHAGQNWDDYFTEDNSRGYEGTATTLEETWDVDAYVAEETIDGIVCNVYTVLYHGILSAGDETTVGMTNVYLDTRVDTAKDADGEPVEGKYSINGNEIDYDFSNGVHIPVKAYGIQAAGFEDVYAAYAAYNAQVNS